MAATSEDIKIILEAIKANPHEQLTGIKASLIVCELDLPSYSDCSVEGSLATADPSSTFCINTKINGSAVMPKDKGFNLNLHSIPFTTDELPEVYQKLNHLEKAFFWFLCRPVLRQNQEAEFNSFFGITEELTESAAKRPKSPKP